MPLGSGWRRIGFRPSCGISYPRCRSDSRLISINPFRHAIRQKIMRLDGRRRLSGIVVQNRVADWSRAPQGCVVVPGRRPNHVGGARSQASRGVGAADRGKAVSWKAALYLIGLERSGPGSSRSCNLRTAGEASEALWRRPRSHPSRSAHPVSPLQPWIERRESAGLFARGPVVHWRNGLAAGGNRIRTFGPAPAKGSSGRSQSETAALKAEPLTGSGPRRQCLPGVAPQSRSLRRGTASSNPSSSSGKSGELPHCAAHRVV